MAKIMFIIEMLVIEENSVLIIYLTSWNCEIFSNLKECKKNIQLIIYRLKNGVSIGCHGGKSNVCISGAIYIKIWKVTE